MCVYVCMCVSLCPSVCVYVSVSVSLSVHSHTLANAVHVVRLIFCHGLRVDLAKKNWTTSVHFVRKERQ